MKARKRGRYFNADCATHAIKSQVPFINRIMLIHILRDSPKMSSNNDVLMACQVTRSFSNRACLDALGRQLQPSRDTGECLRRCKDYGRIFHRGS
ncbi:hypothetical protein TNCV_1758381 [Trichonephila clavipes]|nr:hypothetical protein TNCV_1758381 [Trichonephila clavipes]